MLVSIVHRATGDGLAVVGALLFTWWLAALAGGKESYDWFVSWFSGGYWSILGYVIGIGLTLSLFQHMMSGIRHFVLDAGAGYELKGNRLGAIMTIAASVTLTILFWAVLLKDAILAGAK
jgi:succinate dehydrogenase / fumarate reductase, cytochrome b subunit